MISNQPPIIMTGDVGDDVFYNREGISKNGITVQDFNDTGDRISLIYNPSEAIRFGQRQYTYAVKDNIIYQEIYEVKGNGLNQIQAQRKDVVVEGI